MTLTPNMSATIARTVMKAALLVLTDSADPDGCGDELTPTDSFTGGVA